MSYQPYDSAAYPALPYNQSPQTTQYAQADPAAYAYPQTQTPYDKPLPAAQPEQPYQNEPYQNAYGGYQQQQQQPQASLQQPQAYYHTPTYSASPVANASPGSPLLPASTPVSLQPEAQKPMTLTTWNAMNMPLNGKGEREWSHGLCSCCDEPATCCLAWMFPCLIYGENKSRQSYLKQHSRPHPEGGEICGSDTWTFCLTQPLCGAALFLQCSSRGKTRERYRISGNGCTDCLATCYCLPCGLTQQNREIEEEENMLIRHQYALQ